MKHIIRHLHRISKNCDVNLMEPKNLAIIFGPSIIRTTNDTLESAVKDMKHQCRIVESLVTNYEFFFEDGELPELDTNSTISSTCTSHHDQTTLLLHNVPKIEQRNHDKESTFKRFMPNLRTRTHTNGVESVLTHIRRRSLEIRKSPDVSSKEKKSSKSSKKTNGSGSSIGSTSGGNEDSKDIRHIEIISSPISDYDVDDGEDGEENGSTATSNSNENLKEGGSDSSTKTHSLQRKPSSTGSMSLAAITDTLDTKLKNLRSGSESNDESSIGADNTKHNRPLISYENIPYVDDDQSPERHTNPIIRSKLPINHLQKPNNYRYSSVYESFSDDSEVSTTSDPKESLVINPSFLDRYKKRRDYKLFRSASFNCRNYRNGNRSGENNTTAIM
uniref:Rho-GAP domain-containing protein n=1 Tax=Megaselia scalaris TaxID=36166 RepID=T1GW23_MEGSC